MLAVFAASTRSPVANSLLGVGPWLVARAFCELVYWLAARDDDACVGALLGDVAAGWGGSLVAMVLSTACVLASGYYWSTTVLRGHLEDADKHLPVVRTGSGR